MALLTIGDELLAGRIDDTNATWLCREIVALGAEVIERRTLPDEVPVIAAAFRELAERAELVISTGGLGPTQDDLTAEALAVAVDQPLRRCAQAAAWVEEAFARRRLEMPAINLKQADLPEGATALYNPEGTAPAFTQPLGQADIVALPGVPREMKTLFQRALVPHFPEATRPVHRFRCLGDGESTLAERLAPLYPRIDAAGLRVAYRATMPEVEVSVSGEASAADLQAFRDCLGAVVYAEGETRLPALILERLRASGRSLALAESCTGGLLAKILTDLPGASEAFVGSVVSYSNASKVAQLGVDAALIAREGAVSEAVAVAMARGATRRLGSDYGLGITGVAGPGGGSADKPVGTVWIALAQGETLLASWRESIAGDRSRVRLVAAWAALRRLLGEIDATRA